MHDTNTSSRQFGDQWPWLSSVTHGQRGWRRAPIFFSVYWMPVTLCKDNVSGLLEKNARPLRATDSSAVCCGRPCVPYCVQSSLLVNTGFGWPTLTYLATGVPLNYNSQERSLPPRCLPGTRRAVLEEISMRVKAGVAGENILWFHGPGGWEDHSCLSGSSYELTCIPREYES